MKDLMHDLPTPQPTPRPAATVSLSDLMGVLKSHSSARRERFNAATPDTPQYVRADAAREAVRELIIDILSII